MSQQQLTGLSLRDLDYALAVFELGHFGRAAARCGVSQPGLSEQIRKLEAVLGTTLFERGRGRVAPTQAGQALLRQIATVVRESRALLEMARSRTDALEGPIDLGVIPTLGPYYIPLVLRDLRAQFPRLTLRLQEAQTTTLLDALARFTLDAALIALPAEAEGFASSPLFFEPFTALLPAGHRLAKHERVPLDALPADEMLLLEDGHCLREQAVSLCRVPPAARGATSAGPRHATSLEMLRHMVAAGEGFALMPALATREASGLGELVALRPLADGNAGRTIGLVWRVSDPRAPDFKRLAGTLRSGAPGRTGAVQALLTGDS